MKMDTKWKLITWGVYATAIALGLSIIVFSLSAVFVVWQHTNHEFFWWTIPHAVVGAIVAAIGFVVAISPLFVGKLDKKITYRF